MTTRGLLRIGLALAALGVATDARALLTVEQAIELSQKTGRPIFAVAGSKT